VGAAKQTAQVRASERRGGVGCSTELPNAFHLEQRDAIKGCCTHVSALIHRTCPLYFCKL